VREVGAVGGYGRFGVLSRVELERFFHLDDEDRRLIAARRRDHNRLGFALQLVTVRYLGMFLTDPLDVPAELIEYLAEQLDIDDPACVKAYVDRDKTRLEHAWEIQREEGLASFAEVEGELSAWIADQAWMTGDGPKAIFEGAVAWLRKRPALLPQGVTTLERLVAQYRQAADQRLWADLSGQLNPVSARMSQGMLVPRDEGRRKVIDLERLRRGVFKPSAKGLVTALSRLRDVNALIPAEVDIAVAPPRRLQGLAAYGLSGRVGGLRRLQREHQLAVLVATVVILRARATDDALDLFDQVMVNDLMSKAERQSKEEKLRRYPRVSRSAGKLASAVRVLLEMTDTAPELSLELVWDLIENTVTRAELRTALATVDDLVPPSDAELDGQRAEELAGRVNTVRMFLPVLMRTVEFGATSEGRAVLTAMHTLAELLTAPRARGVPARWFDARRVDHDLIGGAWSRLAYPADRPAETVDRAAYTLCVLEQFHRHLKHRTIFAELSSKWRDPRAHLLSGVVWEQSRDAGMNALGLPDNPHPLLAGHAAALDSAYRELIGRLGDDAPASVDAEGRLHVAALTAVPDPSSLVDLRHRVAAMLPRIELAQLWGGGLVASVDGLRFVVPARTHHARPNPKYFGRKKGATWLNMINDQAAGLSAMVLSGTPRDSLHAVDVVLRQQGGTVPDQIITDTGSYSDIVFGLLHLLGRTYRPQLANLPDQRLWRIDTAADYGPLDKAARGRIDTGRIASHWEDMCRIAVSMHAGEVSGHEVTRMISRDGNPTPLGHAIAHYGRIFKTLHILRLADDEPYRREGKAQSNLTEGRHDLARRIFHGRKGEITRAYLTGMEDQLSALGLVLNCAVLWNTVYMNRALQQLRAQQYPVLDEDAARLSPFVREHIGLDGHYTFHLPDLGGTHRPLRNPDANEDN
jgi:TnpA family transposase